jgi:hypothetical protein
MNWEQEARGILRAEMSRRRITYKVLASRLEGMGIPETYKSVASKVGRGTFSFVFFLQAMRAMGIQQIDLSPLDDGDVTARL